MTIPAIPMQLLTSSDQQSAHLSIMGDITSWPWGDEDTSSMDVSKALADLPSTVGEIFVHINSYGGEVAEGVAIYNALKGHSAHITTVCEGFACSIASVIFMAGDDRVMRPASLLMLHNASMFSAGDANAHRKVAEDLDVITELSKTAYLSHATEALTPEKLTEVMDAETWVTPEQAFEWGLATEIDNPADEDEPTQSARTLIAQRLCEIPCAYVVSKEQIEAFAARVAQIVQKDDEDEDEDDEPEPEHDTDTDTDDGDGDGEGTNSDSDKDDEEKRKRSNQRFARIFEKLSSM